MHGCLEVWGRLQEYNERIWQKNSDIFFLIGGLICCLRNCRMRCLHLLQVYRTPFCSSQRPRNSHHLPYQFSLFGLFSFHSCSQRNLYLCIFTFSLLRIFQCNDYTSAPNVTEPPSSACTFIAFCTELIKSLLKILSDSSDEVVFMNLQVAFYTATM